MMSNDVAGSSQNVGRKVPSRPIKTNKRLFKTGEGKEEGQA